MRLRLLFTLASVALISAPAMADLADAITSINNEPILAAQTHQESVVDFPTADAPVVYATPPPAPSYMQLFSTQPNNAVFQVIHVPESPEPSSIAALATGLTGVLIGFIRKRK